MIFLSICFIYNLVLLFTKVEFLHLKSMEDHIRLKDPETHKAKLLEILQENEKKRNSS